MVMSPNPFSLASSSSSKRKFRGTIACIDFLYILDSICTDHHFGVFFRHFQLTRDRGYCSQQMTIEWCLVFQSSLATLKRINEELEKAESMDHLKGDRSDILKALKDFTNSSVNIGTLEKLVCFVFE